MCLQYCVFNVEANVHAQRVPSMPLQCLNFIFVSFHIHLLVHVFSIGLRFVTMWAGMCWPLLWMLFSPRWIKPRLWNRSRCQDYFLPLLRDLDMKLTTQKAELDLLTSHINVRILSCRTPEKDISAPWGTRNRITLNLIRNVIIFAFSSGNTVQYIDGLMLSHAQSI